MTQIPNANKLVLLAKKPGRTSFASLFSVKKAFSTNKVGHTGTLDSFASGLLVVCTGALTRLSGRITEFNKTYEAVLAFGAETDTLEWTGNVIKTADLPTEAEFRVAVNSFVGKQQQLPPLFSAIHVNGERASDLARAGKTAELTPRPIEVFSAVIKDVQLNSCGRVQYAHIEFSVSKGTYIRSLARDIAYACKSAAHLVGLMRTKVGNFCLSSAAGFAELEPMSIKTALLQKECLTPLLCSKEKTVKKNEQISEEEKALRQEIVQKSLDFSFETARECGFGTLILKEDAEKSFFNGAKLYSQMFTSSPFLVEEPFAAVFTKNNSFAGLLQKNAAGYFSYSFVCQPR